MLPAATNAVAAGPRNTKLLASRCRSASLAHRVIISGRNLRALKPSGAAAGALRSRVQFGEAVFLGERARQPLCDYGSQPLPLQM